MSVLEFVTEYKQTVCFTSRVEIFQWYKHKKTPTDDCISKWLGTKVLRLETGGLCIDELNLTVNDSDVIVKSINNEVKVVSVYDFLNGFYTTQDDSVDVSIRYNQFGTTCGF